MSLTYELVNCTKKEVVSFLHIPAVTGRELAGLPAAASITAWYLLRNRGDEIAFVSDEKGDWPFRNKRAEDYYNWPDVTDKIVAELIEEGILHDDGILYQDADAPELYLRKLTSIWGKYSRRPIVRRV